MTYEEILKTFSNRRRDYSFPPSALDNLNDAQRKEIERLIIRNCLSGDTSCFDHLSSLKFYDITKIFTFEELEKFDSVKMTRLIRILYEKTNDNMYIDYLLKISPNNTDAYSLLTILYQRGVIDSTYFQKIVDICNQVEDNKIYIEMLKRITNDEEILKKLEKKYIEDTDINYKRHIIPQVSLSIKYNSDDKEEQKKELASIIAKRDKYFAEMGIDLKERRRKEREELLLKKKNKLYLDSMRTSILGFTVGDALGVPYEFKSREAMNKMPAKDMIGFGTYQVYEGTWSDDTSLMLATMDSITEKGNIDCHDIMYKFTEWVEKAKYTAGLEVFDIGTATARALNKFKLGIEPTKCGGKDVKDNGNGSLMRMLPIAFYIYDNNLSEIESIEIINKVSSLTHANEISLLGCKIYCDFIMQLLDGKDKFEAYEFICEKNYNEYYSYEATDEYIRVLTGNIERLSREKIKSTGYIVNTLESCIWATVNSDNFEDAVLNAINLGGDTDTIGALTGAINGIIYGKESIPNRWLEKIQNIDYLNEITDKFIGFMKNNKEYKSY